MSEIAIDKDKLVQAYKAATDEQKQLLADLYGEEIFRPQDITERIKTFEDACNVLGEEHALVTQYRLTAAATFKDDPTTRDLIAYLKLRIITTALNEGWEPTFDEDELRYYVWFYMYSKSEYEQLDENEKKQCVPLRSFHDAFASDGLVFANAFYAGSYSVASYGVRLALRTRELAEYCGKQFINIWADFLFK